MKRRTWYIIGFGLIIGIFLSAFLLSPSSSFVGSDDQGSQTIHQVDPNYVVWFHSIWIAPPEIQTLLFSVQAAIGASIIGFFVGNERGKRLAREGRGENDDGQEKNGKTSSGAETCAEESNVKGQV